MRICSTTDCGDLSSQAPAAADSLLPERITLDNAPQGLAWQKQLIPPLGANVTDRLPLRDEEERGRPLAAKQRRQVDGSRVSSFEVNLERVRQGTRGFELKSFRLIIEAIYPNYMNLQLVQERLTGQ